MPRGQITCSARGHRGPQAVTYELGLKDQEDLGPQKGMECGAKRTCVGPWAITPITQGLVLSSSNLPASRNSRRCNTMSLASCKSRGGPQKYPASWPEMFPWGGASSGGLSWVRPFASLCPEVATSPRELMGSAPEAACPPTPGPADSFLSGASEPPCLPGSQHHQDLQAPLCEPRVPGQRRGANPCVGSRAA